MPEWSGGVLEVPGLSSAVRDAEAGGHGVEGQRQGRAGEREAGRQAYIIHVCDI